MDELIMALEDDHNMGVLSRATTAEALALSVGSDKDALARAAFMVFGGGIPAPKIKSWAMHLLCSGRRVKNPLRALSARGGACGHVFKHGDIAWNCRTCQKDSTCVLCDACFSRSAHVGHDVVFHRAAPGGICDCGIPEAWHGDACCELHRPGSTVRLDGDLEANARIVLRAAVVALCKAVALCVRAHDVPDTNASEGLTVRLHNDDVHTIDEVEAAVAACGASEQGARRAVHYADMHGEAAVVLPAAARARDALVALHSRDLLASAVDAAHLAAEQRAECIAEFLSEVVKCSDGLRRLVAEACAAPLTTRDAVPYVASRRFNMAEDTSADGARSLVLSEDRTTTNTRRRLASTPFALVIASDPLVTKGMRGAIHDVLLRLLVDAVARESVADALLCSYRFLGGLYAASVGCVEDTVFGLSVQIFTTPSLVKKALEPRLGPVDAHPGVLSVVLATLIAGLEKAGCHADYERRRRTSRDAEHAFLDSSVVRHRRFAHSVRDLEYVLQTDDVAALMLLPPMHPNAGRRNGHGRPLEAWLLLLERLQGFFASTSRTATLSEHAVRRWPLAFQFLLTVTSTCELIATRALATEETQPTPREERLLGRLARSAAFRHAYRSVAAALLEWLDARRGSYDWDGPVALPPSDDAINPGLVLRYDIASQPVSLHLPLHRFLTQLALCAAAAGIETCLPPLLGGPDSDPRLKRRLVNAVARLMDASVPQRTAYTLGTTPLCYVIADTDHVRTRIDDDADDLEASERDASTVLGVALAEHPLRALAYCAHVEAGLWRYHGDTALRVALSYATPPLCHSLRDADYAAVALATKLVGAHAVVHALLRIFLVDSYLLWRRGRPDDDAHRFGHDDSDEASPLLDSDSNQVGAARAQSRRPRGGDFLAAVATEAVTLVIRLATELPPPPGFEAFRHKLRRELVHLLAVAPRRHSEVVRVVSIAAQAFGFGASAVRGVAVAPLADELLREVAELERDARGTGENVWELRRGIARDEYDPSFARLPRTAHEHAMERIVNLGGASRNESPRPLVGPPAVAHPAFVNVRADVLRCDVTHRVLAGALLRGANASAVDRGAARELECRALHLATLIVHDALDSEPAGFAVALQPWLTKVHHLVDDPKVGVTYNQSCVMALLLRLRDHSAQASDHSTSLYDEGLHWLVATAARLDAGCAAFIAAWPAPVSDLDGFIFGYDLGSRRAEATRGATPASPQVETTGVDESAAKRKKRDEARKRALATVAKRQAAFSASLVDDDDAKDVETLDVAARTQHEEKTPTVEGAFGQAKTTLKSELHECIVCRTRSSEAPCLVGFAQKSVVMARGIERMGSDERRLARTWIVCGESCVLSRRPKVASEPGEDDDGPIVAKLERGEAVRVSAMREGFAFVRTSSDRSKRRRALCGWVRESELRPAIERAWQRWGRHRIHVSTCGHAMHPSCWETFFMSLLSKDYQNQNFEGRLSIDISRVQFLCPLCKTLSNCLVPDVPVRHSEPVPRFFSSLTSLPSAFADAIARWALAGGARSNDDSFDFVLAGEIDADAELSPAPRDVPSFGWGRRFAVALVDADETRQATANATLSRLAELFATWSATAYCVTVATVAAGTPSPSDDERRFFQLGSRRHGTAAATALARGLEYFPRAIFDGHPDADVLDTLRKLLASLVSGKPFSPNVDASIVAALGASRPSDHTWSTNADKRIHTAFSQPLLAWDLSVALCALGAIWPTRDLPKIVVVVAIARLAQILLEPSFFDAPRLDDRIDDDATECGDDGLAELRAIMCTATGRKINVDALQGRRLRRAVANAWTPFLRVARFISRRHVYDDDDADPPFESLCRDLNIPPPSDLVRSEPTRALFHAWGERLHELEVRDRRPVTVAEDQEADGEDSPFFDVTIGNEAAGSDDDDDELDSEEPTLARKTAVERRRPADTTDADAEIPMIDLSRFSFSSLSGASFVPGTYGFVPLPDSFTVLYTSLLRNTSFRDTDELAICLLTGRVLAAGGRDDGPGPCTLHARNNGDVGVFFLVLRCSTLLVSASHAAYGHSIYIDEYGEEDINLRRGAPLHLCLKRLRALETLYNEHGVAAEVARRRAESSRVIRNGFY